MSDSDKPDRTTLGVRGETHRRFAERKPGGLSADEFVKVLLDRWEGRR